MIVLSVDPGTTWTATTLLDLDAETILGRWYLPNPQMALVISRVSAGEDSGNYYEMESPDKNRTIICDHKIRMDQGICESFKKLPVPQYLVMEMVSNYSQTVGRSVFETCMWSGRFIELFQCGQYLRTGVDKMNYTLITRTQSRSNITGTSRCGDAQVNRALLDRVGEKGTKKYPGPMYGMKSDLYAALAVGLTFKDLEAEYQAMAADPVKAKRVMAGKLKIKPFWVQLEADGGDQTLAWPITKS